MFLAVPNIINGITYSLIVSNTVTSNIDLLELLETRYVCTFNMNVYFVWTEFYNFFHNHRYNFVVIERDYCAINKRSKSNLKV